MTCERFMFAILVAEAGVPHDSIITALHERDDERGLSMAPVLVTIVAADATWSAQSFICACC